MNFRQLECFLAVAEERNFSRAAAKLYISQPAATQHIQQLEAELGFPLFYRSKRSVSLTAAGESLQGDLSAIREQLGRAMERARRKAEAPDSLTIYYHGVDGELFYPRILPRFQREYPRAELRYIRAAPAESIRAVLEGLADFCFVRRDWLPREESRGLCLSPVIRDRECCLVPRLHRLSGRDSLSFGDLDGERVLLFDMPPVIQRSAALLRRMAPGASIIPITDRIEAENLVRTGGYISISSLVACQEDENWRKVPLEEGADFEICAMTRQAPRPLAAAFSAMAVEAFAKG